MTISSGSHRLNVELASGSPTLQLPIMGKTKSGYGLLGVAGGLQNIIIYGG
jgi:hypothetical protein